MPPAHAGSLREARSPREGAAGAPPGERPRLILKPRGSTEVGDGAAAGGAATSPPHHAPRSNPFGDAKPVDTQAKLLELEEKEKRRRVGCAGPGRAGLGWAGLASRLCAVLGGGGGLAALLLGGAAAAEHTPGSSRL